MTFLGNVASSTAQTAHEYGPAALDFYNSFREAHRSSQPSENFASKFELDADFLVREIGVDRLSLTPTHPLVHQYEAVKKKIEFQKKFRADLEDETVKVRHWMVMAAGGLGTIAYAHVSNSPVIGVAGLAIVAWAGLMKNYEKRLLEPATKIYNQNINAKQLQDAEEGLKHSKVSMESIGQKLIQKIDEYKNSASAEAPFLYRMAQIQKTKVDMILSDYALSQLLGRIPE